MNTVLITGANGFVGHYLVAKLLRSGYAVIATAKGAQRLFSANKNFQFHSLDIIDKDAVSAAFQQYQPAIVVHCAAMTKPDDCELNKNAAWAINVTGTENLLAAASETGFPHFVHLSTDFVFAGTAEKYKEEDEGSPVNYYGYTKWEAEKRVQAYDGQWSIVRPILIYGYPQAGRSNILTFVADTLKKGTEVRLFTDQQRRPTYVEDLVWGIEKIVAAKATGIFHFSGNDTLSPFDIGKKVANFLNLDPNVVIPVTASDFQQPAKRPPQTIFDLQKVIQTFNYQPTTFEEGLRKTFSQP